MGGAVSETIRDAGAVFREGNVGTRVRCRGGQTKRLSQTDSERAN
jgi:hypothetical protein